MMTKEKPRTYSKTYKEFMAKQVVLDGKKITELARDNDIPHGSLKRWVAELREKRKQAETDRQENLYTATEYKEMLDAEIRRREQAEEEVEILKKAMHIFNQTRE